MRKPSTTQLCCGLNPHPKPQCEDCPMLEIAKDLESRWEKEKAATQEGVTALTYSAPVPAPSPSSVVAGMGSPAGN
jgi:hypothetical protein